jgi:glycosyltransferase involved in cell wall biosynthesis
MKVLHVIPSLARRYGGPSQAIIEMCQALQSENIEVLIATTNADGDGRLPVDLERSLTYEGVPAIFFSRQLSEAFKYSRPLSSWLDKNVTGFDLLHIHAVFSHSSLAAANACQKHKVPYVIRPLGSLDPWSLTQRKLEKNFLWHLAVKKMLTLAAAIQYTTAAEKQRAEGALDIDSGVVIPLGITDEIVAANCNGKVPIHVTNKPYVLMLSRLHPKKGLELFIEVFLDAMSDGEFGHWRLVIAGDGELEYVSKLKRLVRRRDAGARVIFTGWVQGETKISALRGAALFALPSRQENFAISVAEAMACGVPVLVSEHVNIAREVQAVKAGWVASLDYEALRQSLIEALRSEHERTARGAAGRELARSRYTWAAIARELERFYRSILSESLSKRPLC